MLAEKVQRIQDTIKGSLRIVFFALQSFWYLAEVGASPRCAFVESGFPHATTSYNKIPMTQSLRLPLSPRGIPSTSALMFRRPLPNSVPGGSPSSAISVPSTPESPEHSAKRQKTFHRTPGSAKPKQSLLRPYQSNLNSKKKPAPSPFSSLKRKGTGGKNETILNFFKPLTPPHADGGKPGGLGKPNCEVGARSDDLFVKHGAYGLDVSDPEDDDGDGDVSDGWFPGGGLAAEPVSAEAGFEDEDVTLSIAISNVQSPRMPVHEKEGNDMVGASEVIVIHEDAGKVECIPPLEPASSEDPDRTALEVLPSPGPNKSTVLKFDPTILNLDRSRSILFNKGGETPSLFSGLKKRARADSVSIPGGAWCSEGADEAASKPEMEQPSGLVGGGLLKEELTMAYEIGKVVIKDSVGSLGEEIRIQAESQSLPPPDLELQEFGKDGDNETEAPDQFLDSEDYENRVMGFEELEDSYSFDPAAYGVEGGFDDFYQTGPEDLQTVMEPKNETKEIIDEAGMQCPVCAISIGSFSERDANSHVNGCLDGNPVPLSSMAQRKPNLSSLKSNFLPKGPSLSTSCVVQSRRHGPSAFARLMSTNIEAQAWASAEKSEAESRGKRGSKRTCPFYKSLFGGSITVDAFRYGSIPGCQAYFLSHFHSDHYVGLTRKWDHGPIWCSRATANLVRENLGVSPEWVRELPWEEWTEVVGGVRVRGLDANHCPGSMLFLFEKDLLGEEKRMQRILHCGDFRASPEHLRHPLLMPGKDGVKGQRLDAVYLDTTYLNPKYAFPSQVSVIEACQELCVRLDSEGAGGQKGMGAMRTTLESAMRGVFVQRNGENKKGGKGNLLVVVGTYSIGKERVCLGK